MQYTEKPKIYEDDEELDILYLLNEFADANPSFNSKFLDSCEMVLKKTGFLTRAQFNTLVDIYSKIGTNF